MSAQVPASIRLTILRKGDINIVDLDGVDSLIPRSETQVDTAFLQELAAEVMHLAAPGYARRAEESAPGSRVAEPALAGKNLQRIGGLTFSHLLTEPARKRLRMAEPCDLYLRLDEQLIHIPWELCYDGKDFLATKFRVGRQVITGQPIPTAAARPETAPSLRVLLIADPTESLPEAGTEAELLSSLLDNVPGVEVTLIGGRGARKVPLLTALQDHTVVHFAGHSYYDPENPSRSGWRLYESVLTAGELSKLTSPPLLVFSNSCQAGATSEWGGGYRYEGQAFGIGSAFLVAGVRNYLGTFWVVHDEESVLFAAAFYEGLVSGLSLGEALLHARHKVIRQRGWASLTWASYMLYGDPAFTLLPKTKESVVPALADFAEPRQETPRKPSLHPQAVRKLRSRWGTLETVILAGALGVALAAMVFLLRFRLLSHEESRSTSFVKEYRGALEDLRAGRTEEAFAAFERVVDAPANRGGLGYDGLAALYFEKGLLAQAKKALQQSFTASAANVIAFLIQGDIAFAMGAREQAAKAYEQAAQTATDQGWQNAWAYNALGAYCALKGRVTEARDCFHRALQADGSSAEAYSNLGYLWWMEGNWAEARRDFEKVQDLQPTDELSRVFLTMLAGAQAPISQGSRGRRVLVAPFTLGGGNLRRLGEGEAFASELARHLSTTVRPQTLNREALPPEQREEFLQDPAWLMTKAKESGATVVIWGELQSFSRKLVVHGQVSEVERPLTEWVSSVQEGSSGRLGAAAQVVAGKIGQAIAKQ
jgi:tetratricopeptide (TPR) repeat protein